jgi:hypothetical protein
MSVHTALLWFGTFCATFALDLCWVYYIRQVERGNPVAAASWAGFLYLTAAGATVGYVENPWLLVPSTAGAILGTFTAVTYAKRVVED